MDTGDIGRNMTGRDTIRSELPVYSIWLYNILSNISDLSTFSVTCAGYEKLIDRIRYDSVYIMRMLKCPYNAHFVYIVLFASEISGETVCSRSIYFPLPMFFCLCALGFLQLNQFEKKYGGAGIMFLLPFKASQKALQGATSASQRFLAAITASKSCKISRCSLTMHRGFFNQFPLMIHLQHVLREYDHENTAGFTNNASQN